MNGWQILFALVGWAFAWCHGAIMGYETGWEEHVKCRDSISGEGK